MGGGGSGKQDGSSIAYIVGGSGGIPPWRNHTQCQDFWGRGGGGGIYHSNGPYLSVTTVWLMNKA